MNRKLFLDKDGICVCVCVYVYFNLSEYVKPICLPYQDDAKEDYQTSQAVQHSDFFVAGWGATTGRGNYCVHVM